MSACYGKANIIGPTVEPDPAGEWQQSWNRWSVLWQEFTHEFNNKLAPGRAKFIADYGPFGEAMCAGSGLDGDMVQEGKVFTPGRTWRRGRRGGEEATWGRVVWKDVVLRHCAGDCGEHGGPAALGEGEATALGLMPPAVKNAYAIRTRRGLISSRLPTPGGAVEVRTLLDPSGNRTLCWLA
jgi:hypothetical protein